MKRLIIHARGLRARHIPPHALRSALPLLITCQHCQNSLRIPTMDNRDVRRMVSMIRAIRAGKLSSELPYWAPKAPQYRCKSCHEDGTVAVVPRGSGDAFCSVCGDHWKAERTLETLQQYTDKASNELRAVQTAEAFILLAHASGMEFAETGFLKDCGFTR